jgi:hypothetical protein
LIIYLVTRDRPAAANPRGHWQEAVEGLSCTAREFYTAVEAQLRELNLPGVSIKVLAFHERTMVSDQREYLRVARGGSMFDLCVAPLGNTVFVSTWLADRPRYVHQVCSLFPFGWADVFRGIVEIFDPPTYYQQDAEAMFQAAFHACVSQVLTEMTQAQGLDPTPELATRPAFPGLSPQRQLA